MKPRITATSKTRADTTAMDSPPSVEIQKGVQCEDSCKDSNRLIEGAGEDKPEDKPFHLASRQ